MNFRKSGMAAQAASKQNLNGLGLVVALPASMRRGENFTHVMLVMATIKSSRSVRDAK